MSKTTIIKIGLFFCSLAISIVGAELLVRKFARQITLSDASKFMENCLTSDPHLPMTTFPNQLCHMTHPQNDFNVNGTIDANGYRLNPNNPIDAKKTILFVGDSFIFGWGLRDDQTMPAMLSTSLINKGIKEYTVINAGFVGGKSPDSYYVYLSSVLPKLKPDLVILSIFPWNDFEDVDSNVWTEVNANKLPITITNPLMFQKGHIESPRSFKFTIPVLRDSHLFLLLANTFEQIQKKNAITAPKKLTYMPGVGCALQKECFATLGDAEKRVLASIEGIASLTKQTNTKLIVFLIPSDYQIDRVQINKYNGVYPLNPKEPDFIQKHLGTWLKDKNIPYVDIFSSLLNRAGRNYIYFLHDGHFNPTGAALSSELLAQHLLDSKLITPGETQVSSISSQKK
jgi:lysophospholipase L1-like esterase